MRCDMFLLVFYDTSMGTPEVIIGVYKVHKGFSIFLYRVWTSHVPSASNLGLGIIF